MKKYLLLASVAALAFTSCSDQSTEFVGSQQAREIAFAPISKPTTRTAGPAATNAVDATTYPQNYSMYVVAYSAGSTDYFGIKDGSGNYTGAGVPFSYQFAGGVSAPSTNASYWGGTPAQYWPLSAATINFLAVSNWATSTVVSATQPVFGTSGTSYSNLAEKVAVTLGDNKPDASGYQHDLMYGSGAATVSQAVIPDKVDMSFSHALAWVVFRVMAGNTASQAISIKGIKLKDANYGGSFQAKLDNYNNTSGLAWNTSNTKWTVANSNSSNYSPNFSASYDTMGAAGATANDSKALTTSFVNVGDGLLVVPTSELTSTVSMSSFDIEYYLNGTLYTYTYTPATDAAKTYEKGKKYIYDITMTLHEIYVNPSVENWGDGGTTPVAIPTPAAP